MFRIKSATGITVGAEEEIMTIIRNQTSFAGTEDKFNPFRPKAISLSCDIETTVDINGEGFTYLKLDSLGKYSLNLDKYDVVLKSLKIADLGVTWEITFAF